MLILALADLYVPERATDLPKQFKKLLQPNGKINKVVCLGNTGSSKLVKEYLESLTNDKSNFHMVRGETDTDVTLPQSLVLTVDNLKIGIINGFQVVPKTDALSLLNHARMMDADILISGGTHRVEAYTLDGKFFVNPGTATGAFTTDSLEPVDTSFCLLEVVNNTCTLYLYTLVDGDVKIDKLVYSKDSV
ncbi:hypothetical protein CANINC_000943 [Pichia inconspicua]|uniref:Vacuolar protein sorting-associated protein 29 n=1 Tax=Pichia inconspicua TaxID=52247 RepID=A0A4T0X5Z9_9ASCO|nr:hypothetical protein CANINC_000943 [[Candida] inconspicua]